MAITFCALESVISFHLILQGNDQFSLFGHHWNLDNFENGMFYVMIGYWTARFLHARFLMPLFVKNWPDVWAQKNQHHKDAEHFEFQDPDEFEFNAEGEQPGINAETTVIIKRESLPVWHVASGKTRGALGQGVQVQAKGAPFNSELHHRRLDPREDELVTKEELVKKFKATSRSEEEASLYWDRDCKAHMLVPIEFTERLSSLTISGRQDKTQKTADGDGLHDAAVELAHVRVLTEEEDPDEVHQRLFEERYHLVNREFCWNTRCIIL